MQPRGTRSPTKNSPHDISRPLWSISSLRAESVRPLINVTIFFWHVVLRNLVRAHSTVSGTSILHALDDLSFEWVTFF